MFSLFRSLFSALPFQREGKERERNVNDRRGKRSDGRFIAMRMPRGYAIIATELPRLLCRPRVDKLAIRKNKVKRFGKLFSRRVEEGGRREEEEVFNGASREISSSSLKGKKKRIRSRRHLRKGRRGGDVLREEGGKGEGREGKARSTRPWTPPQVE